MSVICAAIRLPAMHPFTHCIRATGQELSDLIEHGLRLHQHNIGYTADGFYSLMTQPTVSKHWGWLVIQTGLSLTRLTSPCYN